MNLKYKLVYLHMDNENKQLLLEVIGEQYKHYNIKQNNGFMGFFNNIYKYYQRNQGEYNNIQEINKKVVQESMGFIQNNVVQYATNSKAQERSDNLSLKQVDATDLRYVKDDKFDMKLKKREDEFSGLMNSGKPNDIDFSFNEEEELPAADLNKLLGQTLADREKELKNVQRKYNKNGIDDAAKWLKLNEEEKEKGREKLKSKKTVSFNMDELPQTDDKTVSTLLSKLKPVDTKSGGVIELLNTILNNQKEILNLLKSKKIDEVEKKVEELIQKPNELVS
tara:strand:+ start:9219 stop:10058 length:840 start_codon:yes stop_codon:yes gene_type:complete